ncbi:hypothetical protein K457DRAFT_139551 [Linnemannia elongata AG-77]|uniref:Uncharacterized protein n=1 Tax=Linnemannia elongata AG-77 TaxID=1314771 RepID=A0A197JQQ3_9FUNG|nr:hypothetical protein K457DRAFT_139551 [Linnemannia elongata AG-77]
MNEWRMMSRRKEENEECVCEGEVEGKEERKRKKRCAFDKEKQKERREDDKHCACLVPTSLLCAYSLFIFDTPF